jgi:hypothetical protein
MRRHIWAFCHEAHVAHGTAINNRAEIITRDSIKLAGFGLINEVK